MNKYILVLFFSLIALQCKSQNYSLNSKKNTMKKINIESFRKLSIDEKYPQSPNDVFYRDGEDLIRVTTSKTNIQVEKSTYDSPYKSVEVYSIKDSLLIREGKSFLYFPVGIWKEYGTSGKLIKSINYDDNFDFSIDSLIEKMNKEFKINVIEKGRVSCYRYYNKEIDKSFYEVCYKVTVEGEQLDCFLFDGNSGTLLFRVTQYQQDKNGSLYEQYLKTEKR